MANPNIALFHFYFRQLWTAQNFQDWQDGMVALGRGAMEGTFGASILKGFAPSVTGMSLEASSGLAFGPSGYFNVISSQSVLGTLVPPTGNLERAIVVIRPNLVESEYITVPPLITTPVPSKQLQESVMEVIRGVEAASPVYPDKEANDVVAFGLRLYPGQTSIEPEDFDFEVRDIPGKNSNFQQDQAKYDDRLRPYLVSNSVMGILPSQLEAPFARVFSYVNKSQPSIFPKSFGGEYNGAAGVTLLNLTTGVISGADEASPNFTPQIPSAGNAIVATVGLKSDDTLAVSYGTEGTRTQCYDGIVNQETAGAGSVQIPDATKPISFMICYSEDGISITEIDFVDCRGSVGTSAPASGIAGSGTSTPLIGTYPLTLTDANDGEVILVSGATAPIQVTLPAPSEGLKVTLVDKDGTFSIWPLTIARNGTEKIMGLAADYVCKSDFGSWTLISDGTDWFFPV